MRASGKIASFTLSCGITLLSACGFDCTIADEEQSFASCEALEEAYAAEQSALDPPPDGEVLDDMLTCGAVNGCEIDP